MPCLQRALTQNLLKLFTWVYFDGVHQPLASDHGDDSFGQFALQIGPKLFPHLFRVFHEFLFSDDFQCSSSYSAGQSVAAESGAVSSARHMAHDILISEDCRHLKGSEL